MLGMAGTRVLRVSAPGKVLVTGGYLVLDERFAGLVLATSARFHAQISAEAAQQQQQERSRSEDEHRVLLLAIESEQYKQRVVGWIMRRGDALAFELLDDSDRNAYVEETVLCTINGIAGLEALGMANTFGQVKESGESVKVTLQADNDFYSQVQRLQEAGKDLTRSHLQELPRFLPPVSKGTGGEHLVAKTGMGSSAAMVTSLVASMVSFFVPAVAFQEQDEHLQLVHHLAQLAHCYIQRKIGSGFDIAAACFGSQRYTRFPASMLAGFTSPSSLRPADIARCITDHDSWEVQRRTRRFQLPPGLHLMMGDVSSGSATVSMVRKVLAWQKSEPDDANKLVADLNQRNVEVEQSLDHVGALLTSADGTTNSGVMLRLSEMACLPSDNWASVDQPLASALTRVRMAYSHVRELLREMGRLAGVPIEPKEQTTILDATMALPGVLMAGVPGAGGYDAIFVIALHQQALLGVEKLWLAWPKTHPDSIICPLLCDVESDGYRTGVRMETALL